MVEPEPIYMSGPEQSFLPSSIEKVEAYKKEYFDRLSVPGVLTTVVKKAAERFADSEVQKVACIERTGIPLGAALASSLGAGLVILRKSDLEESREGWLSQPFKDYSHRATGNEVPKCLHLAEGSITAGEKVLMVDDQIETMGQFTAACRLVRSAGGEIIGGVVEGIGQAEKLGELGLCSDFQSTCVAAFDKPLNFFTLKPRQADTQG